MIRILVDQEGHAEQRGVSFLIEARVEHARHIEPGRAVTDDG
jgi:hypothetical protein